MSRKSSPPPEPPARYIGVLVAAGRSSRMGTDKLWVDLWGRPTWRWALDALLSLRSLERVAIVVPANAVERFRAALPPAIAERCDVVVGGETRAKSVVAGIHALQAAGYDDDVVTLVHDAARPAASPALVDAVATAARMAGQDAVVPAVAVPDSLKRVRGGRVVGSVEREEVAAAQTPQAARLAVLRAALEEAEAWNRPVTDDVGALSAAGTSVRVIPGENANLKLTEPTDLDAMRGILASSSIPIAAPGSAAELMPGVRCGIGFDAHRLVPGRPMRIGGVTFEEEDRGPEGHSDGDAVLHALIDALLGGAQLGDIGTLFPSGEPEWDGADSRELLRRAVARLREHGWYPTAADVAVAVARPAIGPRREEIIEIVAALLGIQLDAVSVKGTTSDGLGFTAEEGIAAWAVAAVTRVEE